MARDSIEQMINEMKDALASSGAREVSVVDIAEKYIKLEKSDAEIGAELAPHGFEYLPKEKTNYPGSGYLKKWGNFPLLGLITRREIYIYITGDGGTRTITAAVIRKNNVHP